MDNDILSYYERELTFVREMGAEFAKKYPKIASRLLLEPDKCEDPHTERLIEAFAILSGRIHKKIDDAFPEITEALLNIIYPHYVNPLPSMSVVRFETVNTTPPSGYRIDRQTPLYSKPVGGVPCRFATGYPVTLWPVEVVAAALSDPRKLMANARSAVGITLKTYNGLSFAQLGWESLRFFLSGSGQHVFHLRELLFNNVAHIECEWLDPAGRRQSLVLARDDIRPVGFDADEGLIPRPARSFPAYLLLSEYFAFPEKFLFFDLKGLDKLRHTDVRDTVDIWIYFDRTPQSNLVVNTDTFCLNATPVVNLFSCITEPLAVEHRKTEYWVIPDVRRIEATEVFSIDKVACSSAVYEGKEVVFEPFYSVRHHLAGEEDGEERAFWCLQRRSSGRKGDDGTDVFLSFVDWQLVSVDPDVDAITVHATCTNRDLPARLPFGDRAGDFDMEIAAPVARITCLLKPTPTRRPPLGGPLQWNLISHLSLNYMSLVEGGEEALKEILRLYDFDNSPVTRQQINGIVSLKSDRVTKRVGQSFCRGVRVTMEFDEDKYVGTGVYLLASVLERLFGQYVSVNSFSQMVARTSQRKEPLKQWPPRNGNRILL